MEQAAKAGYPPRDFARCAIRDLPELWRECWPVEEKRIAVLLPITYWLLQMSTEDAEKPGKYRDYLPAWEFWFYVDPKTFFVTVEGTAAWSGSA